MNNNNKISILYIIIVVVLLISIAGFSYAYFATSINNTTNSKVAVNTTTVDSLLYSEGSPISIVANQDNFAMGKGNRTGSTESIVTLNVNNMTPANYCYTADIIINANDFVYSINSMTPEIVITVSKNANGSGYQTILNNYDVTTASGTIHIPIASESNSLKHSIGGNPNAVVVDRFKVDFALLNLDGDQSINTGKVFDSKFKLTTVDC